MASTQGQEEARQAQAALAGVTVGGAPVEVTGLDALRASAGENESSGTGVLLGTLLAALGALFVLIFVFRSFMAIVPLLMALVAIPTTFLLIWPIATVTDVSVIVQFLVALIGLGIAIDYALLVVVRWREERQQPNVTNEAAVRNAMQHAGSAVVFSGTTVAISLLALLALPIPALRSIGIAGLLIALVSVAVAVTLLPVVLATIGPRLDWPRSDRDSRPSRGWSAWARVDRAPPLDRGRRRRPPCWSRSSPPPRPSSSGTRAPTRSHRRGPHAPASTSCRTRASAPGRSRPSTRSSAQAIPRPSRRRSPRSTVSRARRRPRTGAATGRRSSRSSRPRTATPRPAERRSTASAPQALPAEVTIGGEAAQSADFLDAVYANFPLMLALISILTFVLLARAFRSLLLPLKAVLLNLLSVGAAWGLIVLVFQKGFGSDEILGIEATQAINVEMPIVIFAFLFGISMDYQVFIISRMREAYDRTGSTETAVVEGIGRTGRLVTSAALILGLAFVAFGAQPGTEAKIFALALGGGILIDATIIRGVLTPAAVAILGRWNWWLPDWAARILRVEPSPVEPKGPESTPDPAPQAA